MVLKKETQVAARVDPGVLAPRKPSPTNAQPAGWAPAPEFDDDHPEELSYRPFPVAPLLTQSASADDEALVKIVHPNLARTLDLLDDKQIVLPMRLRPGDQIAEVLWAQQFQGNAVDFKAHETDAARADRPHLALGQDDGALSGRVCRGFLRPGGTQPRDQATLIEPAELAEIARPRRRRAPRQTHRAIGLGLDETRERRCRARAPRR